MRPLKNSPFDYDDPTGFLKSVVQSMADRNGRLSLRAISVRLGFSDVSILSGLLRGERRWSIDYCLNLARYLDLDYEERIYLELLALRERARTQLDRETYHRQIQGLRQFHLPEAGTVTSEAYSVFTVGSCVIRNPRTQTTDIELRCQQYDANTHRHLERIYRFNSKGLRSSINSVEFGKPESRIFSDAFSEPGYSVEAFLGGKVQSAFFKANYGTSSEITSCLVGQDIYGTDYFRSIMTYSDVHNIFQEQETCAGHYIHQSEFEDLLGDLQAARQDHFAARTKKIFELKRIS